MAVNKKMKEVVLPEGSLDPRALSRMSVDEGTPPVVYGGKNPQYKYNWKYDPETDEWMAIPLDEGAVPVYVLPEKRKDK